MVLLALMLGFTACRNDHDQQMLKVENELRQQRQANNGLVGAVFVLGVGCIVLFGIGAAIGSKVRKAVRRKDNEN
jgi:hypothetical protein